MTEQEITQEELEEVRRLRQSKEQQKPVDFKKDVYMLVEALHWLKKADGYSVKERRYPSDTDIFYNNRSQTFKNPTAIRYLEKNEFKTAGKHEKETIANAIDEIQKEIDEIRGLLG